jgi:hypothetical protein
MSTPDKSRPDTIQSSGWHVRLRQILDNYFDEKDLEILCFDLSFDYESLGSGGKTIKIIELIKEFSRMGRIEQLIDYCSRQRPNIPWAEIRQAAVSNPLVVDNQPDREWTASPLRHPENAGSGRMQSPSINKLNTFYMAIIGLVGLICLVAAVFVIRPPMLFRSTEPIPDPAPSAAPQQQTYDDPTVGGGGYRLDWCYYYGNECGIRAATEWCKTMGSVGAIDFQLDLGVGQRGIRTQVLGTRDICNKETCGSFQNITCVKTAAAPQQQTYVEPTVGDYRLDWCYLDASQCGIRAATEWCKTKGFLGAIDFQDDVDIGQKGIRTQVLGTGGICTDTWCDSFKRIVCVK